ncbi:hypothetical protein [Streptomyces sp. NBC_01244]|uniref:hypothetical protein n=1 Tax=Streptomyces sp. NBC_01244 TaxID=2903797 RepID=UPI002E14AE7C|nr:hypothetical protein OG247_04845 [Streptomyces sp. NBC_01244]
MALDLTIPGGGLGFRSRGVEERFGFGEVTDCLPGEHGELLDPNCGLGQGDVRVHRLILDGLGSLQAGAHQELRRGVTAVGTISRPEPGQAVV